MPLLLFPRAPPLTAYLPRLRAAVHALKDGISAEHPVGIERGRGGGIFAM